MSILSRRDGSTGFIRWPPMSLTRLINEPKVRAVLDQHISKPEVVVRKVLVAPPVPGANPSRVGTAFDYALRFALHARHGTVPARTVAESAVDRLGAGELAFVEIEPEVRARLPDRVREARAALATIGSVVLLSREAAEAALTLAAVDPLLRAGIAAGLDREPEGAEIDDVSRLFRVIPWDEFSVRSRLVTNPTFGEGSAGVGGADADLVVDDMLIEVKVTKDLALQRESIRQVVCYALLANRFGIDGVPGKGGILRVGIYMARARRLYVFPLRDCIRSASEAAVLDELLSHIPTGGR